MSSAVSSGGEREGLGAGLDPTPHSHTPNYHQEKQGLKVSSADSDAELLLRAGCFEPHAPGAGSGWQGAQRLSLSGEVGALQSGGRSSPTFTPVFTHP